MQKRCSVFPGSKWFTYLVCVTTNLQCHPLGVVTFVTSSTFTKSRNHKNVWNKEKCRKIKVQEIWPAIKILYDSDRFLTATGRDDFTPRGTRSQCTAKAFYHGVFDAHRLKMTWVMYFLCPKNSICGLKMSFPVEFPP